MDEKDEKIELRALFPVFRQKESWSSVKQGLKFIGRFLDDFMVLYVVNEEANREASLYPPPFKDINTFYKELRKLDFETGEKVLEDFRRFFPAIEKHPLMKIEEGSPVATIIKEAKNMNANLIVIGSNKKRGFMGKLADKLIRQASIPVMVLPARIKNYEIREILVPIDGSQKSLEAVRFAIFMAKKINTSIRLFHVINEDVIQFSSAIAGLLPEERERVIEEYKESAREYLKDAEKICLEAKIKASLEIGFGDPAEKILEKVKKDNLNLIIMGTKGHSNVKRLLLGSVTSSVVDLATVPVAVV